MTVIDQISESNQVREIVMQLIFVYKYSMPTLMPTQKQSTVFEL